MSVSGLTLPVSLLVLQLSSLSNVVTGCSQGDLRLADQVSDIEGRVEVCYNGQWGTICDDNWSSLDARVVCRQLGLPTAYPDALLEFGGGSDPIHFAGFRCSGNETQLLDCPIGGEITHCQHFEDAGVRCLTDPCTEDEVRLNAGVVQVCHGSQWGLVCSSVQHWYSVDAAVVCQQVGMAYIGAQAYEQPIIYHDAPVILNDIVCSGTEQSLIECSQNGYGNFNCSNIAVAYCQECSTPGEVRLADNVSEIEGRVEICYNGEWGTICARQWGPSDAKVVCRQLGLPTAYPDALLGFKGGSGPTHFGGFRCSGNESNLLDCPISFLGNEEINIYCSPRHFRAAGVRCLTDPCIEDEVRLNDNVVQVCHGSQWGLVCYHIESWYDQDAAVVCRQVGMAYRGALAYKWNAIFQDAPVILNDTVCSGTEQSLIDCSQNGYGNFVNCSYIAVAICQAGDCSTPGEVRLADNVSEIEGRVEICYNGEWGTICDHQWGLSDAKVVCRQLGLPTAYPDALLRFGGGLGPIHFAGFRCSDNETQLLDCPVDFVGNQITHCQHFEDAGVRCLTDPCIEDEVRLNGDVVQVCHGSQWGLVCDNTESWTPRSAAVVCRQVGMGYRDARTLKRRKFFHEGTVILNNINCHGTEDSLTDCPGGSVYGNFEECSDIAVAYCEVAQPCNETNTIRLTYGNTLGRLEVCSGGYWGTVCSLGTTSATANVACRQLNHAAVGTVHPESFIGEILYVVPIALTNVMCTGNETTISECSFDIYDDNECDHFDDVIVNCNSRECNETDIRLVNGSTDNTGRVEICLDGLWGSVCNDKWDTRDAAVVCRQLQYYGIPIAVQDYSSNYNGTIIHLDDVACYGNESMLSECPHRGIGIQDCTAGIDEAGVMCTVENDGCEDGEVRLQDGIDSSNGRVEVCQYRTWGAVCTDRWDRDDARVVCHQRGYDPEDARAVQGFGAEEDRPVLLSEVECTGNEDRLTMCSSVGIGDHSCDKDDSAGVACGKGMGRCKNELGASLKDDERFGTCEVYSGAVEVCNDIVSVGIDFVYIVKSLGTQDDISTLLNDKLQSSLFVNHDKDCVDQVFRILCQYFLPPCGTVSKLLQPSSICQKECSHVQSSCQETWDLLKHTFGSNPFINCEDTSDLLSPIPHCCTGAGIQITNDPTKGSGSSNATKEDVQGPPGGAIAGAVTGIVIFIVAAAIVVVLVLVIITRHMNKKKQVDRMQMDILAMPGSNPQAINDTLRVNPGATHVEMEPDDKNDFFMSGASAAPNPYSVPRPSTNSRVSETSLLGVSGGANRTRVNSRYLRELSLGHFLIKYEHITQLENIGQGEFGIVYKARLNLHGKSGREVAVKTLKGTFDQIEVDKFVEESLKMSRFKHAHVMGLIGVCLDGGSAPYIVMPYMANGSLLKYLKKERENIVLSENADEDEVVEVRKRLMVMCSQIASGMEYLAQEKYVHRDLATRNCMIDSHFLIKITDFGLSEDIFVRNYFRQGSEGEVVKLPIKWMAPESLSDGHFSEKSDVWSYGVTMWEIFSGGKAPFPGTDPLTLMQRLEEGHRMGKPTNAACAEEIYVMMRKCWETSPRDRPTFKELHSNTSKYTERIAGYLDLGFNPFQSKKRVEEDEVEERGFESPVAIQVIPASVETNLAHTMFTNTQH